MGDFYTGRAKHIKAFTAYKKGLDIDPNHITGRAKIAAIYLSQRDLDEAPKYVDQILMINKKDLTGMFLRGRLYKSELKSSLNGNDVSLPIASLKKKGIRQSSGSPAEGQDGTFRTGPFTFPGFLMLRNL
ncbi:MAG: tetratricopeptide repeat protein [Candidatus Hodarchaeota archaeon]